MKAAYISLFFLTLFCSSCSNQQSNTIEAAAKTYSSKHFLECGSSIYFRDINGFLLEVKDSKIEITNSTTEANKLNGYIFRGVINISDGSAARISRERIYDELDLKNMHWGQWQNTKFHMVNSPYIYFNIKKESNGFSYSYDFINGSTLPEHITCKIIPKQ